MGMQVGPLYSCNISINPFIRQYSTGYTLYKTDCIASLIGLKSYEDYDNIYVPAMQHPPQKPQVNQPLNLYIPWSSMVNSRYNWNNMQVLCQLLFTAMQGGKISQFNPPVVQAKPY